VLKVLIVLIVAYRGWLIVLNLLIVLISGPVAYWTDQARLSTAKHG
jgi:hypothetical protein